MILFHRLAFDKKYIVLKGEPRFKEFSHTRKIPRWSGRDSNPRLRVQRQARSPLSHPTTLVLRVLSEGRLVAPCRIPIAFLHVKRTLVTVPYYLPVMQAKLK